MIQGCPDDEPPKGGSSARRFRNLGFRAGRASWITPVSWAGFRPDLPYLVAGSVIHRYSDNCRVGVADRSRPVVRPHPKATASPPGFSRGARLCWSRCPSQGSPRGSRLRDDPPRVWPGPPTHLTPDGSVPISDPIGQAPPRPTPTSARDRHRTPGFPETQAVSSGARSSPARAGSALDR